MARTTDSIRARAGLALFAAALLALTASCAVQGSVVSSTLGVPDSFSQSGSAPLASVWWLTLEDEQLNGLMDQALAGNFSIRSAWDRLNQARALARKAGADLWPSLDGTAGFSRTASRTPPQERVYTDEFSLGLSTSYEVDLWGRVRAARDAAQLDAMASEQDLHAAAMSLTAQVAGTWYQLAEARGQIKLIDQQTKTSADYLELVTLRFRRGQASATDVLQQQELLESTRADKVRAESNAAVLENQLAVLIGRAPGTAEAPPGWQLPELPSLPDTGLPADWLRRRPDIRAAYLRVQANDRDVAAAIADRFPRIDLSARGQTTAVEASDLFRNWFVSLAGTVATPLLDGGQRAAEVDRTRAVAAESLHSYEQTVLTGLQEVEDALARETHQRRLIESLQKQLELSASSVDRTRETYTKGGSDFLRFLSAQLSYQALERNYLAAQDNLVQYRIDLYTALGGAWDMQSPGAGNTSVGLTPARRPVTPPGPVLGDGPSGDYDHDV